MRVGFGYDVHRYDPQRKLVLGGVQIDYQFGLSGHSDADVLIHALMDSLFGACALGDIGTHFPDTDPLYLGADSLVLLDMCMQKLSAAGYQAVNIDATIVAQEPKIAPYIPAMRQNLAGVMRINIDQISIKATTEEYLGFTGRLEGVKCCCVAAVDTV